MTTIHPPAAAAPPPVAQVGPIAWVRKNLFSGWFNSLLTILLLVILGRAVIGFLTWATTAAKWQVIPANLALFFVGRYPASQYWRIWLIVLLLATLAGASWGILSRHVSRLFSRTVLIGSGILAAIAVLTPIPIVYRLLVIATLAIVLASAWIGRQVGKKIPGVGQWLSLAWALSFLVVFWLIVGGLGLPGVSPNNWGGLMLTVFMSVVSIILCFPLGILLALGRQSNLPIISLLSTVYIEVIRGLPLISILFVGSVMVPLFLPGGMRPDLVTRAIVGLTLFSAAYLAENVRGGLQSIPKGQTEAANALGLNAPLAIGLIVLPQALKISIPAMVGQFISLLQDTTLVSIIGLFELLGISRSILSNPQFIGRYAEAYLFIGVIYWILCYAMSWGSRRIEQQLHTGR